MRLAPSSVSNSSGSPLETPALYLAFDLLATAQDKKLSAQPLGKRRPALEAFAKLQFKSNPTFHLSQATAGSWIFLIFTAAVVSLLVRRLLKTEPT